MRLEQRLALVETVRAIEAALPDRAALAPGSLSGETAGHQWLIEVQPFPDDIGEAAKTNPWTPQSVALTVQSPSGSTLRIDTIRLQQRPGQ